MVCTAQESTMPTDRDGVVGLAEGRQGVDEGDIVYGVSLNCTGSSHARQPVPRGLGGVERVTDLRGDGPVGGPSSPILFGDDGSAGASPCPGTGEIRGGSGPVGIPTVADGGDLHVG
jgi:hypothetical protein